MPKAGSATNFFFSMRFPLIVIVAACAAAYPSFSVSQAQPARPASAADHSFKRDAALPKWAQPLAEIPVSKRSDPVVIRLNETQQWVGAAPAVLVNRATQINDASSLGLIGQYGIDYFSAYQKVVLHRVAILRDGHLIDHTHSVSVRPLQRETGVESGMVGGATTLQFLLDDVRVGDTLWTTYTVSGENPVFGRHWSGEFSWDMGLPIESRLLTVTHAADRPLYWRQLGDFHTAKITPKIERVGQLERLRFETKALEPVENEPSIPSDYIAVRMLQFSEYRDWREVAAWAKGLFPKVKPSPALSGLARRFAGESGQAAQASAALRWVQNEIRYFSVSIGENSHRPQAPDVVLKRRYGDCKDKSYLLISLLSDMGIAARPVLLSATAPRLPGKVLASPSWFNHVIVQITIDGRDYYVDPTSTGQPEPLALIPSAGPGAAALLVDPASSALITLPERPDTEPHYELVQDIALAEIEGDATMKSRDIFRGSYADYARLRYPAMSVSEQSKALLAVYEKRYPGITMVGAPLLKDTPAENKYELIAHFKLPKPATLKEEAYSIEYDPRLVNDTLGIPDKLVRNFPFAPAAGKYRGRYRLNLAWPQRVRVHQAPYSNTLDSPYFRAHEEYSFRGNVVNYLMDYRIKMAEVEAAQLPAMEAAAKGLNNFSIGHFKIAKTSLLPDAVLNHTARDLDSVRTGVDLFELHAGFAAQKDAEIDRDNACRFVQWSAGMGQFVGGEVMQQAARLEKVLKATPPSPTLQICLADLAFQRGDYAASAKLYRAAGAAANDGGAAQRNLAWADFYAGDTASALATLAELSAARVKMPAGLDNASDLVDRIALLQRAGQALPPELMSLAAALPDGPWPRPLLAMQAGISTPAQLIAAAEALPGDARSFALTEAWFYLGQLHLSKQDTEAARKVFQAIVTDGIRSSPLFAQAQAELQRTAPAADDFKKGVQAFNDKDTAAALAQFEKGAAAGDPKAMQALAYMYSNGTGVAKDLARAVTLLEASSAKGYAFGSLMLGAMHADGTGVPKDPARALALYLSAAEQGLADAQVQAGLAYREGLGVKADPAKALLWLARASQQGNHLALFEMGQHFEHGWSTPRDEAGAVRLYRMAAQAGLHQAQLRLGYMYRDGRGVSQDLSAAAAQFRLAALQGNEQGQRHYGHALLNGIGVRANHAEAIAMLRAAVANGAIGATPILGDAYARGHGVAKDAVEAVKWFRQGAEADNAIAQYFLAAAYANGEGVPKDAAKALEWYAKSATNGDSDAARILGDHYAYGMGVERDYVAAAKWHQLGSDGGDPVSKVALGKMYLEGKGVPKDGAKAFALFKEASAKGNAIAEYQLGVCYETGEGTLKDYQAADLAYRIATSRGVVSARNRLFIMFEDGRLPGKDTSGNQGFLSDAEREGDTEALVDLGSQYVRQNKFDKAEAAFLRALRVRETSRPADDLDLELILRKLMWVYSDQVRFAQAEQVQHRILALVEKRSGSEHPDVAEELDVLANLKSSQEQSVQVEPIVKRALSIREKAYGPRHAQVADTLLSLANVYEAQDKLAQSAPLRRQALAMMEGLNGPDHLDNTGAMLGVAYHDFLQGNYAQAEPLFLRVLKIKEAAAGGDESTLTGILNNLGSVYQKQRRFKEAEALFARVLSIKERSYREDTHMVATALNNLGLVYIDMARFEQAEPLMERSLKTRLSLLGAGHGDVAISYKNLAVMYTMQKKYALAELSFSKALAILEATKGGEHSEVAEVLNNFGYMLTETGRYAQAEPVLLRALATRERALRTGHPDTRQTMANLAEVYRKTGRAPAADAIVARARSLM